ncbi:MAG: hypothetical protein GY705_03240, partial [Bacteroidetes bacterium]|nr:hypothetical protein [Bacteroidota bacterium]
MKSFKFLRLSLLALVFILSCQKEESLQPDKIDIPESDIVESRALPCDHMRELFCVDEGQPVAVLEDFGDDWVLYASRAFGDAPTVTAINNKGQRYLLTLSDNEYLQEKAITENVSKALRVAMNLPFQKLNNKQLSASNIKNVYGADAAVTFNQGVPTIGIQSTPTVGEHALLLGFSECFEATVMKYVEHLGKDDPFSSPYTWAYVVEESLNDYLLSVPGHGSPCFHCPYHAGVVQVILDHEAVTGSSAHVANTIKRNYLSLLLELTGTETNRLKLSENQEILVKLFDYVIGKGNVYDGVEVGNEVVDLLEEGVMNDACSNNTTQQDMLLSVMNETGFHHFDYDDFYETLGDGYDYVIIQSHLKNDCSKYHCVIDEMMNGSLGTSFVCDLLSGFDGTTGNNNGVGFHLIISAENFASHEELNNSAYAFTQIDKTVFGDYTIQIVINTLNCENINIVEIFETVQHELIHADIKRRLIEVHGLYVSNDMTETEAFHELVFKEYGGQAGTDEHKLMLEYYLEEMVNSLIEMNNAVGEYDDFVGGVLNGFPLDALNYCDISYNDVQQKYIDFQNF